MPLHKKQSELAFIVSERPFPEFANWWKMGEEFIGFMSEAILSEWTELDVSLERVQGHTAEYLHLVYNQDSKPALVDRFIRQDFTQTFYSGEFDALSFAFYRSAFEVLAEKFQHNEEVLAEARRQFTKGVGVNFFTKIQYHLQLHLPPNLNTQQHFNQLQSCIDQIEIFLLQQGYLRDMCHFTFEVDEYYAEKPIRQNAGDFLDDLLHQGVAYALYIMGYPAILPSAVYLYQMFGEAQHHSSRMIEELFARVGYTANEADDFDPSRYPSNRVVELWSIRP